MNEQQNGNSTEEKKTFHVKCIFLIHARRIGWIRTIIGGFMQYLSVLEFIFIHLTTIVLLYQGMLAPFFNIKKFKIRDYIRMDRGKIKDMVLFDRINCDFCSYANGTAKLWNDQLDAIASSDLGKGMFFRKLISGLYAIFIFIFIFFNFFFSKVLYFIISLFLGLHWTSTTKAWKAIKESKYGARHNPILRWILRFAKLYAYSLSLNLEQIESQWCPLKHKEGGSMVLPEHHKNFYDSEKLQELYEVLERDGSVSPLKPRY
jgi:hypothetical protein